MQRGGAKYTIYHGLATLSICNVKCSINVFFTPKLIEKDVIIKKKNKKIKQKIELASLPVEAFNLWLAGGAGRGPGDHQILLQPAYLLLVLLAQLI